MESNSNNQVNFGQLTNTISNVGKAFVVSKLWRIVAFLVVGLGVGIYFIIRSIKKNALENIPLPEVPEGTLSDPSKGIPNNAAFEKIARQYSEELFNAIDGWFTLASTKEKIFIKLMALNDSQLVFTHRVYTTLYFAKYSETMTQAIENEKNTQPAFIGGIQEKLVTRLKSLGAN